MDGGRDRESSCISYAHVVFLSGWTKLTAAHTGIHTVCLQCVTRKRGRGTLVVQSSRGCLDNSTFMADTAEIFPLPGLFCSPVWQKLMFYHSSSCLIYTNKLVGHNNVRIRGGGGLAQWLLRTPVWSIYKWSRILPLDCWPYPAEWVTKLLSYLHWLAIKLR